MKSTCISILPVLSRLRIEHQGIELAQVSKLRSAVKKLGEEVENVYSGVEAKDAVPDSESEASYGQLIRDDYSDDSLSPSDESDLESEQEDINPASSNDNSGAYIDQAVQAAGPPQPGLDQSLEEEFQQNYSYGNNGSSGQQTPTQASSGNASPSSHQHQEDLHNDINVGQPEPLFAAPILNDALLNEATINSVVQEVERCSKVLKIKANSSQVQFFMSCLVRLISSY